MLEFQQKEVGRLTKQELLGLGESVLFAGLSAGEVKAAVQATRPNVRRAGPDGYLLQAGDAAMDFGVVLTGAAAVVREEEDGSRAVQARLVVGDLFGESFALAQTPVLPVSVVALAEGCTAALFSYGRLWRQNAVPQRLYQNLLRVLAQKNILLNERLGVLSKRSTRQKLLAYLQEQSRSHQSRAFTIPFDRQALADYLCVERSALSAEISRMAKEGILESQRSCFKLL